MWKRVNLIFTAAVKGDVKVNTTTESFVNIKTKIFLNLTCDNIHYGRTCGNYISKVLEEGVPKTFNCNRCWKEYNYIIGVDKGN